MTTTTASSGSGGASYQGTIVCGSTTCTVPTEVCCGGVCAAASGGCITPADTGGSSTMGMSTGTGDPSSFPTEEYCDDSSDCGTERCCVTFTPLSIVYQCATDCGGGWESCLYGITPCSQGLCVVKPDAPGTFAQCNASASLPCGSTSCSGATPICCATATTETCTGIGACQGAAFACDSQIECGLQQLCCGDASGSTCSASCGPTQVTLCETVNDCPPNAAGSSPTGCAAPTNPKLPAGFKACVY